MSIENRCPKCGKEMRVTIDGSAMNFKCESCGYSYATTFADGIEWDSSDYTITLEKNDDVSLSQIKIVSSISSLNFIGSKRLLENGGVLTTDCAITIKGKILKLKQEDIRYIVTPEFPYE